MSALATLTNNLAARLGMGDGSGLIDTLKATAFKGQVNDAQMAALLVVANQYGLNPWTKEIYAFPDKQNGIVPVVGVDGWARIINEHSEFDGMEFRQSEKMVKPDGCNNTAPEWMECVMYRKDRSRAIVVREYLDEVYRAPFKRDGGYAVQGPWQTHTKRFLRHKTMIQCARLAFGFSGIYDQDEAERIAEADKGMGSNRNPQDAASSNAPDGFDEYEAKHLAAMQSAAANGPDALSVAFHALPKDEHKAAFWAKHRAAFHAQASTAVVVDSETGEVQQ